MQTPAMKEQMREAFAAWWGQAPIELEPLKPRSINENVSVWAWQAWQAALSAVPESHIGDSSKMVQPTDISKQLREYAADSGYSHNDYADTMLAAAEEIERYYGGMLAWKKTAETKDRKLSQEIESRISERCAARLEASQAQKPAQELLIRAEFECKSNGIVGTTSADVKRVEKHDDGSVTVVIDHWPFNQRKQEPVSENLKNAVATVLEGWTLPDGVRKILETAYFQEVTE